MRTCYTKSPNDSLFGIDIYNVEFSDKGLLLYYTIRCSKCNTLIYKKYRVKDFILHVSDKSVITMSDIENIVLNIGIINMLTVECGESSGSRNIDNNGIITYTINCRNCTSVCIDCNDYRNKTCKKRRIGDDI